VKAPTAANPASSQLGFEQGSVALLVRHEVLDIFDHFRCTPSREPALRPGDADRAVLAGMVNLQHAFADRSGRSQR
jgi:hypothetical protein